MSREDDLRRNLSVERKQDLTAEIVRLRMRGEYDKAAPLVIRLQNAGRRQSVLDLSGVPFNQSIDYYKEHIFLAVSNNWRVASIILDHSINKHNLQTTAKIHKSLLLTLQKHGFDQHFQNEYCPRDLPSIHAPKFIHIDFLAKTSSSWLNCHQCPIIEDNRFCPINSVKYPPEYEQDFQLLANHRIEVGRFYDHLNNYLLFTGGTFALVWFWTFLVLKVLWLGKWLVFWAAVFVLIMSICLSYMVLALCTLLFVLFYELMPEFESSWLICGLWSFAISLVLVLLMEFHIKIRNLFTHVPRNEQYDGHD